MSVREKMLKNKNGKIYVVHRPPYEPFGFMSVLGALTAYVAILAIFYGVFSFNRPDLIEEAFNNKVALGALLFGLGVVLIALTVNLAALGRATFEKVKNPEARSKVTSIFATFFQWVLQSTIGLEFSSLDEIGSKSGKEEPKEDCFNYGAFSIDTPFEAQTSNILKSLSAYATSSEVTATKLLDKGVAFMAGGLVFYVLAIIVWQVFANFTHPDSHVMYIGMAACSMTFIVVEFLAAWFFKQYRYYVEVSLSCLRVRSVYDRYLLSYYALREFNGDADEGVRNKMTEILKEDVKWPTYKGGVANDFNYMAESMGAALASVDKMKDVFQPKKKANSKAKSE